MSIGAILPSSASLSPGYSVPPVQPSAPQQKATPSATTELSAEAQAMVEKLKARDLNYAMLSELNVKPRTTYLARVRNPHPELV